MKLENPVLEMLSEELNKAREAHRDAICGAKLNNEWFYELRGRLACIEEMLNNVLPSIDRELRR